MVASIVVVPVVPPVIEVARRHAPVADAAGHRRAQFGELQVELGLPHRRLVGLHRRLGVALGLRALLEHLLGDGLVAQQLLAARMVGLGEDEVRARQREIGARLVERVLERPLVDGEQEVALLDDLAVVEMHAVEIAGHAGAHLDAIDRNESADIFVVVDDVALHRLRHRHGRRRRRLLRALAVAAGGEHGSEEHKKEGGARIDFHFLRVRDGSRCGIAPYRHFERARPSQVRD